ncbi:hypothetical protein [Asanoa iriomotensis]|uniref:Uncharacterized protein n=1 Tax=Asanoa iriomotensis TaxID=234613 RepID=A0ABQ4CGF2_9ACTN|nr:hypothetical protein [Asanoa iriomotensis]GIF61390.1 hypothetical protein Air01nite_74850 [Asanoa iriomotensis]
MVLIELDRPAPEERQRPVGRPARKVVALGVLAALAVQPGERLEPAAPRPAPECTVLQADGPTSMFAMICRD